MNGPSYWVPGVAPSLAKGHEDFAVIEHAGPWTYSAHPSGGTLATWPGCSLLPDDYRPPRQVSDRLHYLAPLTLPNLYDLARPIGGGCVVTLACGLQVEIPVAIISHRQLRLSPGAERYGDPVTEFGRLAMRLLDQAKLENGLPDSSPDLLRLLTLAFSQRYRVTAELLDDLGIIASEDTDQVLAAVWCGDPKAAAPASDGITSASLTSASPGAP